MYSESKGRSTVKQKCKSEGKMCFGFSHGRQPSWQTHIKLCTFIVDKVIVGFKKCCGVGRGHDY